MDHAFELAFNLVDEAAGRIQQQQYGITRIPVHNHGEVYLTTVHGYTRESGHHLVLFASDDHGQLAALEASASDLDSAPRTRILKVRAGELTFHAVAGTWSFRATDAGHTYTLTAGIGDEPMWATTIDHGYRAVHDTLDDAVSVLLTHHARGAAA